MNEYDFKSTEAKWQQRWAAAGIFKTIDESPRQKFYALEYFPYPSGAGLSVGHCKNYIPSDAFCRYKHMRGFNVLHPMGWDAFGQPAENEAIKRRRNPRQMVPEYAANFRRTLDRMGCSYDWSREINSSEPEYYHWTQSLFLLLHSRGLAYRAVAPINWCPACQTGLANEEARENRCWRCETPVEKRPLPQWFFKITAYAQRLLDDLDQVDWPEGIKRMQREWIGRSEGAEIVFKPTGTTETIPVFTTRPDTVFGATFLVLAPEHPSVARLTTSERRQDVEDYVRRTQAVSDMDRSNTERTKTGVFTGSYATNPATGEAIPIWVADYVLMGYGSGAIMAVPAHDQRDFEFAQQHRIPIRAVYRDASASSEPLARALTAGGTLINSGQFNGLPHAPETISRFIEWIEHSGCGRRAIRYRLRDWLISRQRYWGAPIPIIHCPDCGAVPVAQEQLPVRLPDIANYEPSGTGQSPLATVPEFVYAVCPRCSKAATRETDTMGGFACSSWYFLRFADPHNSQRFAAAEKVQHWLPVDLYCGGPEHAVTHLLYARFWTKVMYDAGLVPFCEPFAKLRNQGSMLAHTPGRRPQQGESALAEDEAAIIDWIALKPEQRASFPVEQIVWRWARMSKSKGNVVTPDEVAQKHGADALRIYTLFATPFEENVRWDEDSVVGAARFISRCWRWATGVLPRFDADWTEKVKRHAGIIRRKLHQTIATVTKDVESFRFNTAISALMELLNECQRSKDADTAVLSEALYTSVLLLAPFAPHLADELWERMGRSGSSYDAAWPQHDPSVAAETEIELAVQLNGKVRGRIRISADADEREIEKTAVNAVAPILGGKVPRKVLVVRGKLVSIVANEASDIAMNKDEGHAG